VAEMDDQYVYDEVGRQTAVIVSINLWSKMSRLAKEGHKDKSDWDPSKYMGMYKDLKIDVKKESAALRDEWTRA
jgi:hypothetical protein